MEDIDRGIPGSTSNPHVLSPTGQRIEYNNDYAGSVAQYLLDEGILIHVSQSRSQSDNSSILITPERVSDNSEPGNRLASSYDGKDLTESVRRLGMNSAVSIVSGVQSAVSFASVSDSTSAMDSPGQTRRSAGSATAHTYSSVHPPRAKPYEYGQGQTATRRRSHQQHLNRPAFSAEATVYYRFAGSEDEFFQSQILMSSIHLPSADSAGGEDALQSSSGSSQDFVSARMGTLCLVYDLLSQRARKERLAKQFISTARVQEQRRQAAGVNCDLIFKM